MLARPFATLAVAVFCLAAAVPSARAEQSPSPLACRPSDGAYTVESWSTDDGLPQSTVTSIVQSPDGYLWVGTLGGLARFDGVRFQVFGSLDGLPSPRVVSLLLDRNGALWIGTEGAGVARYADGVFTAYSTDHGLGNPMVLHLAEDRTGGIWAGTPSGLYLWQGGRFRLVSASDPSVAAEVTGLAPDDADGVWVTTFTHLCRTVGGSLSCEDHSTPLFPSRVLQRGPDELWIGTTNGLSRRVNGRVEVIPVCDGPPCASGDEVWALTTARSGDVWLAGSGGLVRQRAGRFTNYSTTTGLPTDRFRAVYEDREGNIWGGTNDAGLVRLKAHRLTACSVAHGLSHEVVTSVAEDRTGDLWVATACGGLHTLRDGRLAAFADADSILTRCVFSLNPARDGGLWMGTWGDSLLHWSGGTLRRYTDTDGLSDRVVLALHEDRTGGVWIGTYSGALDYLKDGVLTRFTTREGLAGTFLTSIVEQSDGTIWVASNGGGLTRIANGVLTAYRRVDGLGSTAIRTLMVDTTDTLWIGTTDAGLIRYHDGRFVHYDSASGLPDDSVSQILEDALGNLWIGSGRGISRLLRTELDAVVEGRQGPLNVVTLGKGDGMIRTEAVGDHSPSAWKTRDGRLWFATYGGLVQVDPIRLRTNTEPPPVVIEQVVIDGTARGAAAVLRVAPGTRSLQIQFTALSLVDAARNRFRYRLIGWDPEWIEAGTRRAAEYGRLPPGTYEFAVSASNNDGVWNPAGARMQLVLEPHIWQAWWFLPTVMLVALGGLSYTLRAISVARIRRQLDASEREGALNRERARIARDMHDELGARLTNVAMLADSADDPQSVRQVSDAVRQAVRAMDETVWTVNPRNDSLENFASYASKYATEFLSAASIHCRLAVPLALPAIVVSAPIRHGILLVVKEALNNVVKHAGATEAHFRLGMAGAGLTLQIADNGSGLSAQDDAGHRNGLRNMRERVEGLGGTLEIESSERGTTLTIVISAIQTGHTNR